MFTAVACPGSPRRGARPSAPRTSGSEGSGAPRASSARPRAGLRHAPVSRGPGPEHGECASAAIPVRDSKVPHGPAVVFSVAGWTSFITALKGHTPPPSKA
ncbi:DUF397 domain-containing protein [Streptomyces sp. NPDC017890]|uniref:DUF397 domain-containing protein n=1 Tax=Streptomyces sp. NPDC017890 TaxID=3365015 RepID=UPI0037957378